VCVRERIVCVKSDFVCSSAISYITVMSDWFSFCYINSSHAISRADIPLTVSSRQAHLFGVVVWRHLAVLQHCYLFFQLLLI
jgi:hypothetical protein